MEAQWTIVDWINDWFIHFLLGWLGGSLGFYLTETICFIGRGLLCSLFSEPEVDRYICRSCWWGCIVGSLASHILQDWVWQIGF
jgi:hypothetical protein